MPADGVNFDGMLGVDAALDGVAADLDLVGENVAEALAGCDAELGLDEVDAGDGFGDGVLHLDARVHLDEVELAVFIHEELDGAGVLIADFGEATAQGLADLLAHFGRDLQRRRFFDEFLMAALDGALALKERGDVAVLVGEHLELDVARLLDELLHVELAVAEGVGGFSGGGMEEVGQFFGSAHDAHAATAAAGLGFENDGVADLCGDVLRFFCGGDDAVGAGKDRDLGRLHCLAGFFFFAHEARDFRRRADELDVGGAADFGEVGVLAEQAVAGMNGVDVGDFSGGDDGGNIEIAVGGARRADADGLVGKAHVERIAIGFAVDGDGTDSEFAACVEHAQSNFTAIGNQDLTKHSRPLKKRS